MKYIYLHRNCIYVKYFNMQNIQIYESNKLTLSLTKFLYLASCLVFLYFEQTRAFLQIIAGDRAIEGTVCTEIFKCRTQRPRVFEK